MDLVSKLWNFCHTLRHEGIDYSDYIEELTYLLFLKIAEEKRISIPKGCAWQDLIKLSDETLLISYNKILLKLSRQDNILGDIFSQPIAKIRNASSLKRLLTLIDEKNWSSFKEDVLGSMFEGLLEKAASESKKGAGQYFTPRPLIDAIISVMKPNPLESENFSISDVACGTGGFVISSYEWWKSQNKSNVSSADLEKLRSNTYFGQELVVRPRRLAQMNLYLHGIEPNIVLGDTIYEPLSPKRFSCILTNPPFGTKGANQIPERKDFKVKTSNKQLNFIQHVYSALEKGGRAAIVLPDNVLFEDKAAEIWSYIMKDCNVHTILRLPRGTFSPYAQGVKANVVFMQKGTATKHIWFFDARSNVDVVTKKDRPLLTEHFQEFEFCYGKDPNGNGVRKDGSANGRFQKVNLKEIVKRNYNLDITWIKENSISNQIGEQSPEDALQNALSRLEIITRDVRDILNQLDK